MYFVLANFYTPKSSYLHEKILIIKFYLCKYCKFFILNFEYLKTLTDQISNSLQQSTLHILQIYTFLIFNF